MLNYYLLHINKFNYKADYHLILQNAPNTLDLNQPHTSLIVEFLFLLRIMLSTQVASF